MAKDESQTGGKPSVRARKGAEVHVRRAEKPLRGKKKRVVEATVAEVAAENSEEKPSAGRRPTPRSRTRFIEQPEPPTAPELSGQDEQERGEAPRDDRQAAASPEHAAKVQREGESQGALAEPASEGDAANESGAKPESARPASFSERLAKDEPEQPENPKKRWKKRLAIGVAAAIVVVLAVTAAAFSWNRWARYDDRADMQGIWYAYGTRVPVTFTEDAIVFDENTAYAYEIDPDAKTIRYTIGDMEGQGRYWFSEDRGALVITDGDGYTKWGTVLEDVGQWVRCLFVGASLPLGEQSIAFSRSAMSEGLLTAEPEPAPEPPVELSAESSSSSSSESEAPGEDQPEAEQPGEAADENPTEESSTDDKDGKEAMKELPISDIVLEDDTPRWGE